MQLTKQQTNNLNKKLIDLLSSQGLSLAEAEKFTYLQLHLDLSLFDSNLLVPLQDLLENAPLASLMAKEDSIKKLISRFHQELLSLIYTGVDENSDKQL